MGDHDGRHGPECVTCRAVDPAADITIIHGSVWRAWWARQALTDAAIFALTITVAIAAAYDFVAVALVVLALVFRAFGAYLLHRAYRRCPRIEVVEAVVVAKGESGGT